MERIDARKHVQDVSRVAMLAAAIAALFVLLLIVPVGCGSTGNATTEVTPGESSASSTSSEIMPKTKTTRSITVRVSPPRSQSQKEDRK